MKYWYFTSINKWFTIKLPENWSEYEDEEGTAAFFNTVKWSGNLRITPLRIGDAEIDKTPASVSSINNDNSNAIIIKLGDWDAAFYKKESSDVCTTFYWTMGTTNFWFVCSFTIDIDFLNTEINAEELIVVEEILGSIKILN